MRAPAPSDLVEFGVGARLRDELADALESARSARGAGSLERPDGAGFALALRAGLRGWAPLPTLRAEELVRLAYGRALHVHAGATVRPPGALPHAAVQAVIDHAQDRIAADVTPFLGGPRAREPNTGEPTQENYWRISGKFGGELSPQAPNRRHLR